VEVKDAPMPKATPGHIVVKNAAIAINPADWKMHYSGWAVKSFPTIFGCDIAGEVYELGEGVTGFVKNQRVMGNCCRLLTGNDEEAGFQLYTLVVASLVAPIPEGMSYEEAVVLPLSVATAADGLYSERQLGLPLPNADEKANGATILIWGGSSSVGCSVIQMAKASGLDIVTTASKQNFELVETLGARIVFDHRDPKAVGNLVNELRELKKFVGVYDCIGTDDTTKACSDILSQLGGGFLSSVAPVEADKLPNGVKGAMIFAEAIKDTPLAKSIFVDYLPAALKDKTFLAMPKAEVVGTGLETVQAAMEKSKTGVSAVKLVIKL